MRKYSWRDKGAWECFQVVVCLNSLAVGSIRANEDIDDNIEGDKQRGTDC